jgi:soluble P-type ATPase
VGAALGLPVAVVHDGEDKARMVRSLGASSVVAIGNGRNDVPMFQAAALAIAVLGPEGADPHALMAADIVAADPLDAIDLLLSPARLRATLRI